MDFTEYSDIELSFRLVGLKKRKTGRTTRLVDAFVQELFEKRGEWVNIFDHYHERNASELLIKRIVARLKNEHGVTSTDLDVNYNAMSMRILPIECDFSMHKYEIEQIEQEIERRKKKNS